MRKVSWMLAGTALALSAAGGWGAEPAQAKHPASIDASWARWQGRLALGSASAAVRPAPFSGDTAPRVGSASLVGDYYFSRAWLGPQALGGFRATSGLIFGPRSTPSTGLPGPVNGGAFTIGSRGFGNAAAVATSPRDPVNDTATLPYVGVGYSGLAARGGWSFSADLGLLAQTGGSARLGRSVVGNQVLDDAVRELRMTPLVQLGVTYSF